MISSAASHRRPWTDHAACYVAQTAIGERWTSVRVMTELDGLGFAALLPRYVLTEATRPR
jgi:hypothetical protein